MSTHQEKPESPWSLFLTSFVMMALTVGAFALFQDMEASGSSLRIHWIVALVYMFLGKWGIVGIGSLISLGTFFQGAGRLLRSGR